MTTTETIALDNISRELVRLLEQHDPDVAAAMVREAARQADTIELIASENHVSTAVMHTMGSWLTNKYAEGYPSKRYYGGCEHHDVIEDIARDRAKELFGCGYANVQPHSGSQANLAVYFTYLKPGDKTLSLDLAAGGHLSHGLGANLSGRWFEPHHYGVIRETGLIDYDIIADMAEKHRPQMLIGGFSAYSRVIDWAKMREIADSVDAYFVVDMAHVAGLIAALATLRLGYLSSTDTLVLISLNFVIFSPVIFVIFDFHLAAIRFIRFRSIAFRFIRLWSIDFLSIRFWSFHY